MSYFPGLVITDPQLPQLDATVWVDQFHALRTEPVHRVAGTAFTGNTKDPNFWTESVTGTGTVDQTLGVVTLATGITADSTATYTSVRRARWIPGTENVCRHFLKVGDTGTLLNTRRWGLLDATDGVFFQLAGTTLSVVTMISGAPTAVPQASWNGNKTFTLDTNLHLWEIRMSEASVVFYIDKILRHTVTPTLTPAVSTLKLPIALQNINAGGGAADVSLASIVSFTSRIGPLHSASIYKHLAANGTTVCKYSSGRLNQVIVNSLGASSNILTLYDNTSAAVPIIAVIDTGGSNAVVGSLLYDLPFVTGLTAVLGTGTAADVTIVYE